MADSIDELFACFEQSAAPRAQPSSSKRAHSVEPENLKRPLDDLSITSKRQKIDDMVNLDDINLEEFENRTVIQSIGTIEACTHEVVYPSNQSYRPLQPPRGEPAKTYPFVLDPFQKESILCVDNDQSVLVSAHTSAGKTVIAEYAVALALKNQQRVIYTTPIKALSNQKYREFLAEFKDVGLITGDVTINPTASCLIMTTEILRNMLYKGSEIMREIGWVIFDEIHYMRDKERGVVWEETLILLPHNVHFVFLSATIPNARQFAEWVVHLHQQPCHVVYTNYRPTPLQHYVHPAGGNNVHLVVNEDGEFKEDNFNAAMASLLSSGDAAKGDERGRKGGVANKDPTQTDIFKLAKMIDDRDYWPAIVFSFSKKQCERYAMQLTKLDYNTNSDKAQVDEIFNNAMAVLSEEDRNLPQLEQILPLLRRGIGIHHGGLLPILKELIELLFDNSLIKVLFATETFAMGLNMPAMTVLFTGIRKFDGSDYRWITSGEYIQMSGRAGRRGKDDRGKVFLMMDEKVPPAIAREIIKGAPDPLNSAFHLTYNMVLNLLRVEEINPEYMLERSFYQFQNQIAIGGLHEKYLKKLEEHKQFEIENESQIASYYNTKQALELLRDEYCSYITKPCYLVQFLQPARLIKIKINDQEYDWGAVVKHKEIRDLGNKKSKVKDGEVLIDILVNVIPEENREPGVIPKPCLGDQKGEPAIISVSSRFVTHIALARLRHQRDMESPDGKKGTLRLIATVKHRLPEGIPCLDPIKDMKIDEPRFATVLNRMNLLEQKLKNHPMHNDALLETQYKKYEDKMKIGSELKAAQRNLLDAKGILQLDELKSRKRILRRLGYCDNRDVIQLKGRVACELSCADELLITELLFNGTFGDLTPSQAAALLSCFVCDEKSDNSVNKLSEELAAPLRQLQDAAQMIAKVSTEANLPLDEVAYAERFKPHLMDVVSSWCNGSTFADLCQMTEIYEGSIVRCVRRLEELLRQMVQASKVIGNSDLEDKFNAANKMLKRDIIFSSSLYL